MNRSPSRRNTRHSIESDSNSKRLSNNNFNINDSSSNEYLTKSTNNLNSFRSGSRASFRNNEEYLSNSNYFDDNDNNENLLFNEDCNNSNNQSSHTPIPAPRKQINLNNTQQNNASKSSLILNDVNDFRIKRNSHSSLNKILTPKTTQYQPSMKSSNDNINNNNNSLNTNHNPNHIKSPIIVKRSLSRNNFSRTSSFNDHDFNNSSNNSNDY